VITRTYVKPMTCDQAVQQWYDKVELDRPICNESNLSKFYNYINKKLRIQQHIPSLKVEGIEEGVFNQNKANVLNSVFYDVFIEDNVNNGI